LKCRLKPACRSLTRRSIAPCISAGALEAASHESQAVQFTI
jgi:hypothetical protein